MSEERAKYKIEGRPSTIFRTVKNKDNPYVMVDRRALDNATLSFKAKGILTYLMSRPDGWEVSVADLVNRSTDGAAAIRTGLKELRDAGHMRYFVSREEGKFTGWHIEVYEIPEMMPLGDAPTDEIIDETAPPDSDNRNLVAPTGSGTSPDSEKPQVENPLMDNRGQVILSTLSIIGNEVNRGKPKIPQFEYWDTLLEIIQADRDIPRTCKAKISLGKPVSFQDGVLTISHPEAEWCNQRFARIFTNLVQGLCPGAAVQFAP